MVKFSDFDKSEYRIRCQRVKKLMHEEKLDVLLVTSENNFRYLSGFWTQFWLSHSRPKVMLFAANKPPVLILPSCEVNIAKVTSWIQDIRSWEGYKGDYIDLIVKTLGEMGFASARIGAELGSEHRLDMPYNDFITLVGALPNATFIDASNVFWNLRMIKSKKEVSCLRRSIEITDKAYVECFANVREGVTERELYRNIVISMMKHGADRPGYIPIDSSSNRYDRHSGGPMSHPLTRGNLLAVDSGCIFKGYWSDFARIYSLGEPTPEQKEMYRIVRKIMFHCISQIKPGIPFSVIMEICNNELNKVGMKENKETSRIGHGIGLDITEPPSLSLCENGVIKTGMVLGVEPCITKDFGFFQLEENIVVTERGCEILSKPAPVELPRLF